MTVSKVALITGGVSGMGLAVAKDLLSKGWNVCVCDLNPPKAEDLQLGDSVIYQKADVTDYESLGSVFLATWAKWKRLDFVFANAGIGEPTTFSAINTHPKDGSLPPKPDLRVYDVNLTAVTWTVYLAVHYLQQNPTPGGRIVSTASGAGLGGVSYLPTYCASKHGVVGLTRSLGPVYVKDNITINCLCPGFVETGLTKGAVPFMDPTLVVPMTAIVDAVNRFIEGSETGCWAAVNFDGTTVTKQPETTDPKHKAVLEQLGNAAGQGQIKYPERV